MSATDHLQREIEKLTAQQTTLAEFEKESAEFIEDAKLQYGIMDCMADEAERLDKVRKACVAYLEAMREGCIEPETEYIFEAAMEFVFDKHVFNTINKVL